MRAGHFTGLAMAAGLSLSLSAPAATGETLTDALIAAYRTSGLLDQQRALLRATDEDVAQAVAALRPVLAYALETTYDDVIEEETSTLQLSLNQLIFNFGNRRLAIDAAKESVLATRAALADVEQQVLLRAVRAYLNVRRNQSLVDLRQNNVRLITEELRAARDRFEVGEVTRTDVSIAEARLASARSALAAAQGDLAQAREEYNAVVGNFPQNLQPPPPLPATAASLEEARAIAIQRHPDIMQAQREVTVAELNAARAETALLPSVSGQVAYTRDDEDNERTIYTLGVEGPIYRGGQISSQIRQAVAQKDAARGNLIVQTRQVVQNVGNAWADLAVARASLVATDQEIRAADVAFQGAREEAALGARTTLDVLDAEQDLLDARTTRVSAAADRYIATYSLLSAMGLLSVEHLQLGIATYDPTDYYNAVDNAPSILFSSQGERLDRVLKSLGRE